MIEIIHHLYEFDNNKAELDFNYTIKYEINGAEVTIERSHQTDLLSTNRSEIRSEKPRSGLK